MLVEMLYEKELWYEDAQWLLHPRIVLHTNQMWQGVSIDWDRLYSTPEPAWPTFFMEGYTGPTPPIPPLHLLQVPLGQSVPPTLPPQDQSVPLIQEPRDEAKPLLVEPTAMVLAESPVQAQGLVEPPAQ
jgi:hypothetical protein